MFESEFPAGTRDHVACESDGRTQIGAPSVMLKPDLAQAIAVTLHELATNRQSTVPCPLPKLRFVSSGRRAEDRQLVVRWTEAGGPSAKPPTRKGFGTSMMQSIMNSVKGRVQLDWCAEGLACEIALPT
jgi:two-component sensor histidine kinase